MISLLTLSCRLLRTFGVVFFLFTWFVLPTRSFAQLFAAKWQPLLDKIMSFQSLLLFLTLLTVLTAHCLYHFLKSASQVAPFYERLRFGNSAKALRFTNTALTLGLLLAAALCLDSALDIDENIHALMMTRGDYVEELNPIKSEAKVFFTQNHVLAQAASIVSMKLFGFEKLPYRFPALLFTAALLLAIPLFHQRLFSTFGYTAVLLFLGLNGFTFWYLHSARGYASLMANTFLSFVIVLRVLEEEKAISPGLLVAYCVSLALSPFVHFFSMIFHLLLFLALIFHVFFNRDRLSPFLKKNITQLLFAHTAILPLFAIVLAHNIIFLLRIGDFEKGESLPLWSNLLKAMGLSFDWQGRAWLAALLVLFVRFLVKERTELTRFSHLFLATSIAFFSGVLILSDAKVFESRFVLPFLLPLLFSFADALFSTMASPSRPPRLARTLVTTLPLLLFCLLLPLISHRAVTKTLTLNLEDFDEFMKVTRELTAPIEEQCYFLTGKRDLGVFARDFYLKTAKEAVLSGEGKLTCSSFYQLRMQPSFDKPVEFTVPYQAKEIWNNGRGMALYHHTKPVHYAKTTN